ncbi:unnamed protein product [Rotaria sp. Silwood2]|nr:unnamed protein product [Rotaria sp. Silwood2]
MINPTVSSTPISASTKRGRNDTSGVSESNTQVRPQYQQITRIVNSNNTQIKRLRGMNQPIFQPTDNIQQPTIAACRFATTRFPFSPFSVIFAQEAREKLVIDDLTKFIRENVNFELKMIAYRRGRSENNECRILIFVENSESFLCLYNQQNWPELLAGVKYTTKRPSIPPQLALVLPYVSLQVDWEEFVQELKDKYPDIAAIIRLKNKAKQPIRAVKLEFLSTKLREEILEAGEISAMHIKYKVVEFFAQANVLICSNCYGIGHFRKNCPQKNESTCKTCGEKCANLKDHLCSGVLKCVHCGGPHISNDAKCKVVQDYRTALTRNLLSKWDQANIENPNSGQMYSSTTPFATTTRGMSYTNVVKMTPENTNANEIVLKKLDSVLAKVEEESNATRHSIEEFKQEMRNRYDETKQQVEVLEEKVKKIEKNFDNFSVRIGEIIQNICSTLLDPQTSQGQHWKTYWQEQIKTLVEVRSSLSKSSK